MIIPNNSLPIPGFVEALPLPPPQTMLSADQGPSTRKLKENLHGIHNPIRRTFTVPVALEDVDVHDAIHNTLLYIKLKRPIKANGSKEDPQSEPENKKSALDIAIEKEKDRLEKHFKTLKSQSVKAKAHFDRAQERETEAKQDLIKAIKDRDQEMKKANASPPQPVKDSEDIVNLNKEKDQIEAEVKEMEKVLKTLEDSWAKEDVEKQHHLDKQKEERKRKAEEQIEEQQKKKQRIDKESEISEIQRLEQELKTQSQMIWLMKQVITVQNDKKAHAAQSKKV
eukprot:scaffold1862_cov268-Chaetoceros_neogracile.AAC.23